MGAELFNEIAFLNGFTIQFTHTMPNDLIIPSGLKLILILITEVNMASKKNTAKRRASNNKRRSSKHAPLHYSIYIITLILTAILLGIFLYIDSSAFLSKVIKNVLLSLFSISAYFIPPILVGLSIYISKSKSTDRFPLKLFFSLLACVFFSAIYQVFSTGAVEYSDLAYEAIYGQSGGLLGGVLANLLVNLIGNIAAAIILIFALLADISMIFKVSLFSLFSGFISGLLSIRNEVDDVKHDDVYNGGKKTAKKISDKVQGVTKKIDFSVGDDADEPPKKKTTAKSGNTNEKKSTDENTDK